MKVAITSASSYADLLQKAVESFKELGYTDIHLFIGNNTNIHNPDITCVVAESVSNLFDKHYIPRGNTCEGSRELVESNPQAKVCIYVTQIDTIYEATYLTNKVTHLKDPMFVAIKPLESIKPVEESLKAIYLTQSSNLDSYHNLKKELPGLDINIHTYKDLGSHLKVMGKSTIVFLDIKGDFFSLSTVCSRISEHFRKLINRENTFLMYKPNHSNFKIPYIIKVKDDNPLFSFSGIAGTTQKVYDTIKSKIKSMKKESLTFDPYLVGKVVDFVAKEYPKTVQEAFSPSLSVIKDRLSTVNRVLLLKKK